MGSFINDSRNFEGGSETETNIGTISGEGGQGEKSSGSKKSSGHEVRVNGQKYLVTGDEVIPGGTSSDLATVVVTAKRPKHSLPADAADATKVQPFQQLDKIKKPEPNPRPLFNFGFPIYGGGNGEDNVAGSYKPGMGLGPAIDLEEIGIVINVAAYYGTLKVPYGAEIIPNLNAPLNPEKVPDQSSKSTIPNPVHDTIKSGAPYPVFKRYSDGTPAPNAKGNGYSIHFAIPGSQKPDTMTYDRP